MQPQDARSLAWLSGSYGYGSDLAYFEAIFAAVVQRFPDTEIPVVTDWPVEGYPGLPLLPILAYFDIPLDRTLSNGTAYGASIRIPTLGTAWRIARLRARVFVIIEFTPTSILAVLVASLTRRRTVLLVESDPRFRGAKPRRVVSWIKRLVTRRCDSILVANEAGRSYLRDVVGAPMDKVLVGPYLTSDPAGSTPSPIDQPDGPVRLLFLNSVSARKGIFELVEALASLGPSASSTWHLDIVGDGDAVSAVKEHVQRYGIEKHVTWHGRVPYRETGAFYRACDIVVCPTLADYRSLAGFEAVNAGRPVLMSEHDGAAEEIKRSQPESRIVDPLDPQAFRETLEAMIGDRETVARTRSGRVAVPREFALSSVVDNFALAVARASHEPMA